MISHLKREQIPGAPGIIVEKYVETVGKKRYYVVNLESKMFFQVDFTCDLSTSVNIDPGTEGFDLKTSTVAPFEKVEVLRIELRKNWKIFPVFNVHEKMPSKGAQIKALSDVWTELRELGERWRQVDIPDVNAMNPEQLEALVAENGGDFVDPTFPPDDSSINCYGGSIYQMLECFVHWRHSRDVKSTERLISPNNPQLPLFYKEHITPKTIQAGRLINYALLSGFAAISENPRLVRRLFRMYQPEGGKFKFHKVKICQAGEWRNIVVDDYLPCYPLGRLMFSRNEADEIWVAVLEKAFAKLYEGYFSLASLTIPNVLFDLTFCPVIQIGLNSESTVKSEPLTDTLWSKMLSWKREGFIMAAESSIHNVKRAYIESSEGLSYVILDLIEIKHERYPTIGKIPSDVTKLLEIRNIWGVFEYKKDWGQASPLWTPEIKKHFKISSSPADKKMYVPFDIFLTDFHTLNLCKTVPWNQLTVRGEFERESHPRLNGAFHFSSRVLYEFTLAEQTEVIVGLHQADDKIPKINRTRPMIDMGFWVVRKETNEEIEVIHYVEATVQRQVFADLVLPAGEYFVLPRSDGVNLGRSVMAAMVSQFIRAHDAKTIVFDANIDDMTSITQLNLETGSMMIGGKEGGQSDNPVAQSMPPMTRETERTKEHQISASSRKFVEKRGSLPEATHSDNKITNESLKSELKRKMSMKLQEFRREAMDRKDSVPEEPPVSQRTGTFMADESAQGSQVSGSEYDDSNERRELSDKISTGSKDSPNNGKKRKNNNKKQESDSEEKDSLDNLDLNSQSDQESKPGEAFKEKQKPDKYSRQNTDFELILKDLFQRIDIMNDGTIPGQKLEDFFETKGVKLLCYGAEGETIDTSEKGELERLRVLGHRYSFEEFKDAFWTRLDRLTTDEKIDHMFKLGYTADLVSYDSRTVNLTFHSNKKFRVHSKLASQMALDVHLLSLLILGKGALVELSKPKPDSNDEPNTLHPELEIRCLANR